MDSPTLSHSSSCLESPVALFQQHDDEDGDISANVATSGTVNTAQVGTYTLTYTATDKAGNAGTATRTVRVTSAKLAGTYFVSDVVKSSIAGASGTYESDQSITQSSATFNKIIIKNFGGFTNINVDATVSGMVVTVPSQKPTGMGPGNEGAIIEGSGTFAYNSTGNYYEVNKITYTVTYANGAGKDESVATYSKK